MQIADSSFLDELTERSHCSKCRKSRKYFCYDCGLLIPELVGKVPDVQLPFTTVIVKHVGESNSKSTAWHCSVLAPEHVTVRHYPNDVPQFDSQKTLFLFPDADALSLTELLTSRGSNLSSVDTVVLADCVWSQIYSVTHHAHIAPLTRVRLNDYETKYWRPQNKRTSADLATVEALYYFAREYHQTILGREYAGEYDNLLFFFNYFLKMISGSEFAVSKS